MPERCVPRVTVLALARQGNSHHVDIFFPSSGDRAWEEQLKVDMVWKPSKRVGIHSSLGAKMPGRGVRMSASYGTVTACKENSMLGALTASRAYKHGPLPPGSVEWRGRQPGSTTY